MILNTCNSKKCPFCSHLKGSNTGIETLPGGGVVATGNGVRIYRLLAMRSALRLEAHGFKVRARRSIMKQVKDEFGFKGSRESIMKQLDAFMTDHGFDLTEPKQKAKSIKLPDVESADVFVQPVNEETLQ